MWWVEAAVIRYLSISEGNLLVDISQLTLEPGLGCCWVWQLRVIAY